MPCHKTTARDELISLIHFRANPKQPDRKTFTFCSANDHKLAKYRLHFRSIIAPVSKINLFNDVLFKIAFGTEQTKSALCGLLNAILDLRDDRRIVSIEYLATDEDKSTIQDRGLVLDLKVRDQRNIIYNVELQARSQPFYIERTILYASRAFANQLKRGEPFSLLRKTVHISLLNFTMFDHHLDVHSHFEIYDCKHAHRLTDMLEFHYLEFPKMANVRVEEIQSTRDAWLYYFGHAEQYFKPGPLPRQLAREEEIVVTRETVEKAIMSPIVQDAIFNTEKREQAYQTELRWAKELAEKEGRELGLEQGLEQGIEQGIQEGSRLTSLETAKRMLAKGLSPEMIFEITGIQVSDLK